MTPSLPPRQGGERGVQGEGWGAGGASPPARGRFYVTGGSLSDEAPSYVRRRADAELLGTLLAGESCYVLDTRQVGKSSLMVRAAAHLRREGRRVAVLDLSAAGQNVTPEQWYFGLLYSAGAQLGLEDALEAFWGANGRLGPAQRWAAALQEVALPAGGGSPLVLFVDEIDALRSLPFPADELFAVLREMHNRRASEPALRRLAFCLLGVATPAQLVRDPRTTPFNVGRRIELTDFTPEEAAPLSAGLLAHPPPPADPPAGGRGRVLLARVLWWTGGHPYLTQRLCAAVAEEGRACSAADVDRVCAGVFLERAEREPDPNLAFARMRMLSGDGADPAEALLLYERVRSGRRPAVAFDPTDARAELLRLAGVVRVTPDGTLEARNRLYARAFDRRWVAENLPGAEARRQRRAAWRGALRASAVWASVLATLLVGMYLHFDARAARGRAAEERRGRLRALGEAEGLRGEIGRLGEERGRAAADLRRLGETRRGADRELSAVSERRRRAEDALAGALRDARAASEAEAAARRRSDEERARAAGLAARVGALSGRAAAALALRPETAADALEIGLPAAGTLPGADALAGVARAVNLGAFRRLALAHDSPVTAAAFSPDHRRILTGTASGEARLWDAASGRALRRWQAGAGPVRCAEFSPDGAQILTATGDGAVTLWDGNAVGPDLPPHPVPPRRLRVLQREAVPFCHAEFSPDGRRVATLAAGGEVRLHDLRSERGRNGRGEGASRLLGMEPGGRHRGGGGLRSVSFSKDGTRLVTAGPDNTARVWDAATGRLLAALEHPEGRPDAPLLSARFLRFDDLIVTTGTDRTARLWVWRERRVFQRFLGHRDWVLSAHDGAEERHVVTAGRDGRVMVWSAGGDERPLHVFEGHDGPALCARFSPDEREVVTGGGDGTAQVWRLTGRAYPATGTPVAAAEFSPDGDALATASTDNGVRLFDRAGGYVLWTHWTSPEWPVALAWAPGGARRLAVAGIAGGVRVLTTRTGGGGRREEPRVLWRRPPAAGAGAAAPPEVLHGAADLRFSPDGRLLACAGPSGVARVFDAADGRLLWARPAASGGVAACAAFVGGGESLLLVTGAGAEVVEARTGRAVHALDPGRAPRAAPPTCGTTSPDGRWALIGDAAGRARLYDGRSWRPQADFAGHAGPVRSAAFSPDGAWVATAGEDGGVCVWDVRRCLRGRTHSPGPSLRLRAGAPGARSVRFSADGEWLLCGESDNAARLYPATPDATARRGRALRVLAGHRAIPPDAGVGEGARDPDAFATCWRRMGGAALLGAPSGPVVVRDGVEVQWFPDARGRLAGAAIYSRPAPRSRGRGGAYAVTGALFREYEALGGPASRLGAPTRDAGPAGSSPAGNVGTSAAFEGGELYASARTATLPVTGAMLAAFHRRGGVRVLGYPEAQGNGRAQPFEQGDLLADGTFVPYPPPAR